MLTFTLAISYLTTSNLPWFMDLANIPASCAILLIIHWTLLLSPVSLTTGYCFCFGSIPSFFLEVSYHLAFSYCSWGSQDKNAEVVCYSLLQWNSLLHVTLAYINLFFLCSTFVFHELREKNWSENEGINPFHVTHFSAIRSTSFREPFSFNIKLWSHLRGQVIFLKLQLFSVTASFLCFNI